MPLFFGLVGLVLIICAINNSLGDMVALVKGDFTGQNNFLVWIIALVVAGAFGYIPKFKPLSYAFFALIFLGIFLASQQRDGKSGGFFTKFFQAFGIKTNG